MAPIITMEAEKTHRRLSASWRPRKAGGVILVWVRSLENQESCWCQSSSTRRKKTDIPAHVDKPSGNKDPLPLFFTLLRPSIDWVRPTHTGRDDLLAETTDSNTSIIWKHLCRHNRNYIESGILVAQLNWHINIYVTRIIYYAKQYLLKEKSKHLISFYVVIFQSVARGKVSTSEKWSELW